jgi:endonuclease/exonuclease/phosphatase family metal-dependent hydrolase
MRKIYYLYLFLIFAIIYIFHANYSMKNSLKILSWNILADEFIKKRYYPMIPPANLLNRKERQEHILMTLTHADTDVMLLQEVMQGEYNALSHVFNKSHYLLRGKNIKWQEKQSYSGNVILLRKALFTQPRLIQLKFGVGVECIYQNQPLTIFNIHLDDISHAERMKEVSELLPYAAQANSMIIGGDFNENYQPKNELYQVLKNAGLKVYNHKPTYFIERKMCIDNILIKGLKMKHTAAHVLNPFQGDRVKQFITYGSDHLPVVVN